MYTSWDFVQAKMADQQASAERRRRVATARRRHGGGGRFTAFLRGRNGRTEDMGGCRQ